MSDLDPTHIDQDRKPNSPYVGCLIASGIGLMVVGTLVVFCATGFGGPPPSLREENIFKIMGAAIFIAGAVLAVRIAVRCYIADNWPRK